MNRTHQWLCRSKIWTRHAERSLVPWALAGVDLGDEVLEVGPGYGVTTRLLSERVARLTALEVDGELAERLADQLETVSVLHGDGASMPLDDHRFTGVVCFTMLHHVPAEQLQDQLFAEVLRVLRPGGVFAGSDSRSSVGFRLFHLADTMVIVDPDTLVDRLRAAGFEQVQVDKRRADFRFRARKP